MADKQLAEEIEFDLKMLEEEQKKAAAAKAATAAVSTPQAATPHAQMVSSYTHTLTHTYMYTHTCKMIVSHNELSTYDHKEGDWSFHGLGWGWGGGDQLKSNVLAISYITSIPDSLSVQWLHLLES